MPKSPIFAQPGGQRPIPAFQHFERPSFSTPWICSRWKIPHVYADDADDLDETCVFAIFLDTTCFLVLPSYKWCYVVHVWGVVEWRGWGWLTMIILLWSSICVFQHALGATLWTCSWNFQHALDATFLTGFWNFQHARDAALLICSWNFQHDLEDATLSAGSWN